MKRREFIGLACAAAAWPVSVRSQQPAMPLIGWLSVRSPDDTAHLVAAFRRGLAEGGFVEGQNVVIEYIWALGEYERVPALARNLVRLPLAVLVSTGGEPAAMAAKAVTSTIPIVFAIGGDPVKEGLVASFNRPGGNATGITLLTNDLEPKRLGLLHELLPRATTVGVLLNPKFPPAEGMLHEVQEAGRALNLQVQVLRASTEPEIDVAFETAARQRLAAIAVAPDPFFDTRRNRLVTLAARHAVPTIYQFREYAADGGLLSYGIDAAEVYRQVGVYTGRVLKGAKPADLPVMQASKFQLVINLKTAKSLRLEVPATLLAQADELIE